LKKCQIKLCIEDEKKGGKRRQRARVGSNKKRIYIEFAVDTL
jgi:hypothetical protein